MAMTFSHLFEFMDQSWVPRSLRTTLLEILHFSNSPPFRRYYKWVTAETLAAARAGGFTTIVELGAGTAPITRRLARNPRTDGLKLVVCDLSPERDVYEELEQLYPGKVEGIYEPVDFSQPRQWPAGTLLLLSATFHHLPPAIRAQVIDSMTASAGRVMIFEPVRKTITSMGLCACSIVPSLLLPLGLLGRSGRLRRFFWCWLVPVAPVCFWWEGFISCLRQWTNRKWRDHLDQALSGTPRSGTVSSRMFCQQVVW